MKEMIFSLAPMIARAIVQMFAGSELLDKDIESKLVGVIIFILTIAWSKYEKHRVAVKATEKAQGSGI